MYAALELVGAGPAACALLFLRARRAGARDAADRAVPGLVQRVVGNLVDVDVRPDALLVPIRERVELPGAVTLERAHERLYLADLAAAVRVARPEIGAFAAVLLGDGDHLRPNEVQAIALDQPLARLVALAEEELRVELDDVDRQPELRDHVDEHRRLLLP